MSILTAKSSFYSPALRANQNPCPTCADLEAVPTLLHRRKNPDGSFTPYYGIEARYCPSCGKKLRGCDD